MFFRAGFINPPFFMTKFCHTELCVAKWSIHEFKVRVCILKVWIFRYAQNDKVRRHYKMTKCVFFVRHCEPFSQKRRGNPKIRLEFCPKFKAKIKKDEMLWIQSQILQKCSQTLARPALYRHSFHRDLDLAIQSLLGGVCKGLNPLLF